MKQIEGVIVFAHCETNKQTNQPSNQPTHFISWMGLHKGKIHSSFSWWSPQGILKKFVVNHDDPTTTTTTAIVTAATTP